MEGLGAVGEGAVIVGDRGDLVAIDLVADLDHVAIDDRDGGVWIPYNPREPKPVDLTHRGPIDKGVADAIRTYFERSRLPKSTKSVR